MNFKHLKFLFFIFILMINFKVKGQALNKGDKIPELVLENVYNYNSQKIDLKDYKGKFIIFDFWGPSCKACILSFPKLDSLQKKYSDRIQIFLVNVESIDSTKIFLNSLINLKVPEIPFITSDSILNVMFPNKVLPAIAWIDNTGIFHQMTNTITDSIIQEFISLKVIREPNSIIKSSYVKSLFDPEYEGNVIYHSYISKRIHGVKFNGSITKEGGLVFSNTKLIDLYVNAFQEGNKFNFRKPGALTIEANKNIKDELDVVFNYSLALPPDRQDQKFKLMQSDLERNFLFKAHIKKVKVPTLVLIKNNKINLATKGGNPEFSFLKSELTYKFQLPKIRTIQNLPYNRFIHLIQYLSEKYLKMPFIDGINFNENIDIKMDGEIIDNPTLEGLNSELKKFGMKLEVKRKPLYRLIIS